MKKILRIILVLLFVPSVNAQFTNYYNDKFNGNFVIIGNTLAQDFAAGVASPVVGNVSTGGTNTTDTAPDIFWRSDSPSLNQAEANNLTTSANARSTAFLNLPSGAVVKKAILYWAAKYNGTPSHTALLERPSLFSNSINSEVNTIIDLGVQGKFFQDRADITTIVAANGSGAYRVSGVNCNNLLDLNDGTAFAGWSIIVIYELASEPYKNFQVSDGLVSITPTTSQNAIFSGILVDNIGTSNLGIIAYEGDANGTGDTIKINGTLISNATNPSNNFFNSSRSLNGSPVSIVGDLPQLTGAQNSMSGIDIDVVDVTTNLTFGTNSCSINLETTSDVFYSGALILATPYSLALNTSSNFLEDNLKIFPNPANSYFVLELKDYNQNEELKYSIYDLNGRKLVQKKIDSAKQIIEINDYDSGAYLLEISSNESKKSKKIIKI